MRKLILPLLAITLLLYSCEPEVSFRESQPSGVPVLKEFPAFIRGNYVSEANGTQLRISDHLMIASYNNDTKMPRKELDSSYKLEDSLLVNIQTGQKIPVSIDGDTIVQHLVGIDTLFNISSKNLLKKFRGYYFLNTQYDDSTWDVKKISLEKGELIIAHISITIDKDIKNLSELHESPADSVSKRYNPTRRQFKNFVKKGGFGSEEKYMKVQ